MTIMDNKYGKNVFVTGASSGIGRACALEFAKRGCSVVGVSRNIEEQYIGLLALFISHLMRFLFYFCNVLIVSGII